jgi:hypothetical protein
MLSLTDLHQVVVTTLGSRRLGQPVFVRYLLQTSEPGDTLLSCLAQLTSLVVDWLGQPLDRLYALGSVKNGHVCLTLQLREGATALVGVTHVPLRGEGADLLILGNRGALYHEAGKTALQDDEISWDAGPVDLALVALIDRSLHSGKPENAPGGGMP